MKMKALLKTIPMALPLVATIFVVLTTVTITISEAKTLTSLPGYNGNFPFSLETGYVGVGENKEVQLFYYFAESERNASGDPLLIWFTGGPGCSSAVGFFFQSGPLTFVIEEYDGSLPKLQLNHHRWTKELNILYLDVPFGAGFSYSQNADTERSDDSLVAHTYEFIQQWLKAHPSFSNSELYIGGDGYSGKPIPVIIQEILNGNEAGNSTDHSHINIKGYVIGNPGADNNIDFNAQTTFAHRIGFVPDKLYESAVENCAGNFTTNTSDACKADNTAIRALLNNVNWIQVLEPTCSDVTNDPFESNSAEMYLQDNLAYDPLVAYSGRRYLDEDRVDGRSWCRNYNHKFCATWANDAQVQAALGIPLGAVSKWEYCNNDEYTKQITSVVSYHKGFSSYNIRALIYSGDHDISIPYISTQKWIDSLGLTETQSWRLWSIHNENAGYTRSFKENDYELTYATIKGGGHFAAETNVKECSVMVSRWMAYSDL